MNEFLRFFDERTNCCKMHLEISYCKIADWRIKVYRKGCADDGSDIVLCDVQDVDMELAFAKAQVEMKKWMMDNEGGY